MLTPDQRQELETRGHLNIGSVVDSEAIEAMQAQVWAFLEQRGIARDRPDEWPAKVDKLQPLRRKRTFDAFLGPAVDALTEQLLGLGGGSDLGVDPQALLSLPTGEPWTLPSTQWHFDLPARGPTTTWGAVRFLGFVNDVEPHGGGTLVVEGSHELVRRLVDSSPQQDAGSSADARRWLTRHRYFTRLNDDPGNRRDRLLERGTTIDDVAVRVTELTGAAGELVVMHPWVMHNIAMNSADRPRMMMSYTRYA